MQYSVSCVVKRARLSVAPNANVFLLLEVAILEVDSTRFNGPSYHDYVSPICL